MLRFRADAKRGAAIHHAALRSLRHGELLHAEETLRLLEGVDDLHTAADRPLLGGGGIRAAAACRGMAVSGSVMLRLTGLGCPPMSAFGSGSAQYGMAYLSWQFHAWTE